MKPPPRVCESTILIDPILPLSAYRHQRGDLFFSRRKVSAIKNPGVHIPLLGLARGALSAALNAIVAISNFILLIRGRIARTTLSRVESQMAAFKR